jgi:hypothetical protein
MIDAATADLPAQQGNLLAIGRLNGAHLGVIASVVVPGTITAGDDVLVAGVSPPDPAATAPATQSP